MKRLLYTLVAVSLSLCVHAQFLVESSGRSGFGVLSSDDYPLQSMLSVGDYGRSDAYMTITAPNINHGLYITRSGGTPYTTHSVITALNSDLWGLTENYGIYTTAYSSTPISGNVHSYGLFAKAGNCEYGNIGVLGIAKSTVNSNSNYHDYGIYGSSTGGYYFDPGRFAGYFSGDIKVTGLINGYSFVSSSDYRLKENIKQLEGGQAMDNLMKINTVSYNYKQRQVELADSTMGNYFADDSPVLLNTHYGVIAQELKEIYPDLVVEDASGYLAVNYLELIPILIKSVQELKGEVDALKGVSGQTARKSPSTPLSPASGTESVVLFQNSPNPFAENTSITCDIPESVASAVLYIYDATGRQIDSRPIAGRGQSQVVIEGKSLDAGIYMYSLIADGLIVDTKRMILTK